MRVLHVSEQQRERRKLARKHATPRLTCLSTPREPWLCRRVFLWSGPVCLCFSSEPLVSGGTGQQVDERRRERRLGSSEALSHQRSRRATRRFIRRFKINYVTPQDGHLFYFFDMVLVLFSEQTIMTTDFWFVCFFFYIPKGFGLAIKARKKKTTKQKKTCYFFIFLVF